MPWSRERVAVAAYFAVLGLVCATWASSIDDMKLLLGLDESQQGWLLFSGPVGNLVSFTFASALVTRLGSRRSVILATCAYLAAALSLGLCFLAKAPVPFWCVAIATLGGTGNVVNIAVNTQGGIVERAAGRSIMNSFHAMFSVTSLGAGLLALAATAFGVPVHVRIFGVLVLAGLLHVVFLRALPAENDVARRPADGRWRRPDRALVVLGLAALVIMGCEGSINDWVGVFYRDALAAPVGRVKWGFCAVCATMTLGRLVNDRFINRYGAVKVLRVCSALVASGLALAMVSPSTGLDGLALHLFATAGYAVAGFGISALAPILYSKANRTKAMPAASAVTFIGSMGFLGYFIGPPMIGHIAHLTSLSVALSVFAVLILSCLFLRLGDD